MNTRRQSYCRRPTLSGLRFIFRTLSLLSTTIMIFIRSTPNCNFARKNRQRRIRLKRFFKLCSLLIRSYNINIRPGTTNGMLINLIRDLLQVEKHDELTIKNHHQHRVRAAPLPEIHHNEKKASSSKDNNPKKNGRSTRHRRNRRKNRQLSKTMKKDGTPSKGSNVQGMRHFQTYY
jgi:hypothetical protein